MTWLDAEILSGMRRSRIENILIKSELHFSLLLSYLVDNTVKLFNSKYN